MDAASSVSSRKARTDSRHPLQEAGSRPYIPPLHASPSRNPATRQSGDRFIPNRSAMDFDYAYYMLTEPRKEKENTATASPSKVAYRKLLADTLLNGRTRILAFNNKPSAPVEGVYQSYCDIISSCQSKSTRPRRYIPKSAERILEAPGFIDDDYLNLLDWGSSNILSIALGNTVYLWDESKGSCSELVTINEDNGPVTSVSWAPNGRDIAMGLNSSDIQIYDSSSNRLLRTLTGVHRSRVGSLAWNDNILTSGGSDGMIVNNDVRARSHVVQTYRGHRREVCGLRWSGSGKRLASGGNDNLVHIWELSMSSSRAATARRHQWLHRFEDHVATVKALAWCPFQSKLLASGGGESDQCIKFWDTNTGACLNSINTGSQVCALLWSKNEHELLSSHGYPQCQLSIWKYPSMVKMRDLTGHTSRVLCMSQSPDGCMVASAAGDESLQFWKVSEVPKASKLVTKAAIAGPFASFSQIR